MDLDITNINLPENIINELKENFKMFDKDGSGTICSHELGYVMKANGAQFTEEQLQNFIKQIDLDGSGDIDLVEFLKLMSDKINEVDTEDELC